MKSCARISCQRSLTGFTLVKKRWPPMSKRKPLYWAVWEMPPYTGWYVGAVNIGALIDTQCPGDVHDMVLLPTTAMGFLATANLPNWLQWLPSVVGALQHGQPLFMVLYAALIIFFSFFYTSVVFNPDETAENLRKYGGFIPGIRPGKRTAEYLDYVLTRLTVIGAAYITAVCILPELLMSSMGPTKFALGGTSILIVVTVTMDTVAQIQSHLLAHQYEGLIKKSKLRGGKGR